MVFELNTIGNKNICFFQMDLNQDSDIEYEYVIGKSSAYPNANQASFAYLKLAGVSISPSDLGKRMVQKVDFMEYLPTVANSPDHIWSENYVIHNAMFSFANVSVSSLQTIYFNALTSDHYVHGYSTNNCLVLESDSTQGRIDSSTANFPWS